MGKSDDKIGLQFLTVDEAASWLGVSRLRLREAVTRGLIPGRRDNEGRLRVDVSEFSKLKPLKVKNNTGREMAPDEILDLLFDEVEDLQQKLEIRAEQIGSLSTLVSNQADALDRAEVALKQSNQNEEKLRGVLDKSLLMLDDTGNQLETSHEQSAQFEVLLERAMGLVEAGSAEKDKTGHLTDTAEKAMQLLDRALTDAEHNTVATAKIGDMLGRAMVAGERLEEENSNREETIQRQKGALDRVLTMSERAVGLVPERQRLRRSFFDWLIRR